MTGFLFTLGFTLSIIGAFFSIYSALQRHKRKIRKLEKRTFELSAQLESLRSDISEQGDSIAWINRIKNESGYVYNKEHSWSPSNKGVE